MEPRELTGHQAARAAFHLAAETAGALEDVDPQSREEMQLLEHGAPIVETPPEPVIEVELLPEMSEAERELRAGCTTRGEEPNPRIIEMMRSGEWERRARRNMQKLLRDRARLIGLRHEGYTLDSDALERRENTARPRERKARRASTSSRASPDDSDLPLDVIAPEAFRAAVERALGFPVGAP